MTPLVAAASGDAALAFIEIGAVALVLSVLARLAARLGITAIPLYLLAGLAVGEGGVAPLDVSADFIQLAGEIGVLLLLLTLGLEYSPDELRQGLRTGVAPGVVDAVANFTPGFVAGLVLGWEPAAAVLLGGVCWVSSSGVVSKVLADLDRLGNRETPAVLNLLVIEDLAMAVYLPVVGAVIAGKAAGDTVVTVAIALAAVAVILTVALRWGDHLSRLLAPASDEALLLAVFGLTLSRRRAGAGGPGVGGHRRVPRRSRPVRLGAGARVRGRRPVARPVRGHVLPLLLVLGRPRRPRRPCWCRPPSSRSLGIAGKLVSGWVAARPLTVGTAGRVRAGTVLIARGEFSIVIAALGATTADGAELGALAAAYVLITAIAGPLAAKYANRIAEAVARPS